MLGYLFDFVQVSIAIADVVSDIWVTVEFYENSDALVYAKLMTTVLALASFGLAVLFLVRWRVLGPNEPITWLLVPLCAPLGLLAPVVSYVLTMLFPDTRNDWKPESANFQAMEKAVDDDAEKAGSPAGEFSAGFLKNSKQTASALSMLDEAMRQRFLSYMVLNGQVAFESILSSAVQLAAISVGSGEPTVAQTLSLSLSLFSILSKSFMVARSFDLGAAIFKVAVIGFDLFSAAFLVSTVFTTHLDDVAPRTEHVLFLQPSSTSPSGNLTGPSCNLTGGGNGTDAGAGAHPLLMVTSLTNAWLIMTIFKASLFVFVVLWTAQEIIRHDIIGRSNCGRGCQDFFIGFFGVIFLSLPIMCVSEAMKLSWFAAINNFQCEPRAEFFPAAALLNEFFFSENSSCCDCRPRKRQKMSVDWPASWAAAWRWARAEMSQARLNQHSTSRSPYGNPAPGDPERLAAERKVLQQFPLLLQPLKTHQDAEEETAKAAVQNNLLLVNGSSRSSDGPAADENTALLSNSGSNGGSRRHREPAALLPDNFRNRARHVILSFQYAVSLYHTLARSTYYKNDTRFPPDLTASDIVKPNANLSHLSNKEQNIVGGLGELNALSSAASDERSSQLHRLADPSLAEPSLADILPAPLKGQVTLMIVSGRPGERNCWFTVFICCISIGQAAGSVFSALYSPLFILLHVDQLEELWNEFIVLQRLTLLTSLAFFLIVLVTLPAAIRYRLTCCFWRQAIQDGSSFSERKWRYAYPWDAYEQEVASSTASVLAIIDSYRVEPLGCLVHRAVPSGSVPADAMTSHVLPFLTPAHCSLFGFVSDQE